MKLASFNGLICIVALTGLTLAAPNVAAAPFTPPPPPSRRVTDQAKVLSPNVVIELNALLEQFERSSSSQIVLSIDSKIPEGTTLEEFSAKTFQAWKIGQKGKDNGVVLFAFIQDRKLHIEVGYGLEGAIPDAIAKRIIDETITPYLRQGDYNTAFRMGLEALIRAARGEPFKGNGNPNARPSNGGNNRVGRLILFFGFFLFLAFVSNRSKSGTVYGGRRGLGSRPGTWVFPGAGWGSGGGGSWGGGGGGGFSGGGGRSGGGGASGSW